MKLFPWTGFFYELRRGLRSIPLIVITVLIVLASLGILATIAQTRPSPSNFFQMAGAYYFASNEYWFEFYTYDQFGHPVSGATVNLLVSPSSGNVSPPGPLLANVSGATVGTGLVHVPVPLNGTNYTVMVAVSAPNWNSEFGGYQQTEVTLPAAGVVRPFLSSFTSVVQNGQGFRASNLLQIFYPGPNGTAPPDYAVYWATPANLTYPPTPLAESSMHRLGTLDSPDQAFSLVIPASSNTNSGGPGIPPQLGNPLQVELFTVGGTFVATDTNQTAQAFYPPPGGTAGTYLAFGFAGTVMGYLVPLMAVLAAYSVYGRDRVTGVLEGVLARPVSRLGLTTSRYLAVVAALTASVTAAVGTLDAVIGWVYGGFLPLGVALAIFGALLVEVGAFTGLTFVLAHALRSGAGVVGSSLGLVALFTIGWLILIPIFAVATGAFLSSGYERTVIDLQFVNPTQVLPLAEDLYTGSVQGFFLFGSATAPSAYGIIPASVIADGLAWVLAPAALLVWVVRHRD
jgi:ABC-type transport system involved in multi-copper enzyme maturation permease subunit